MLAIERRTGESLIIGGEVEVEVLDIGRAHVKLAIRAPRAITILRQEVADRQEAPAAPEGSGRDMLILRRRTGESVRIGERVEVGVAGIRCGHVVLGVRAAREISVRRGERGTTEKIRSRTARLGR